MAPDQAEIWGLAQPLEENIIFLPSVILSKIVVFSCFVQPVLSILTGAELVWVPCSVYSKVAHEEVTLGILTKVPPCIHLDLH